MGLSDDLLRQNQRSFGGNGVIARGQPMGAGRPVMPKPTREQLQQWAGETKQYANQGGGGVGNFIKDYGRNAAQLGGGLANVAGGTISAPFMLGTDLVENSARALLGANNPNPQKYVNESYKTVNGGVDKISGVLGRTAGGARELLGWKPDSTNKNPSQAPINNTPPDVVPMTPRQQASIEYNTTGSRPTSVPSVREILNGNVPTFTNVNPSFNDNGQRVADTGGLNIIPSFQTQGGKKGAEVNPQVPAYNPGSQTTIIEDSTRGGYYQQKKADRKNQKTIEGLNNKNKENWQLNRQTALDNSLIANQSESRRLLSSQADIAQRNNELDKVISDFKASPEQRMAALQVRNLLNAGGRRQNNIVTKLSEEMPDGSKRERAVTVDPTTGDIVGGNSGQVSSSYIAELVKKTGKPESDIRNELKTMGIDVT